jgi:protein-S-isoprenylcysteine O-methyltransferase Ste14
MRPDLSEQLGPVSAIEVLSLVFGIMFAIGAPILAHIVEYRSFTQHGAPPSPRRRFVLTLAFESTAVALLGVAADSFLRDSTLEPAMSWVSFAGIICFSVLMVVASTIDR